MNMKEMKWKRLTKNKMKQYQHNLSTRCTEPSSFQRRTDALFALLKEEAEVHKITTQLLGYMLHRENYIHDRAL